MIVAILYVCISIAAALHILFHKNDVRSSIGWIALVFLSPFFGTIAYILFGINRVSRKAVKLNKRNISQNARTYQVIKKNLPMSSIYANQFIAYGRNVYQQEFCDNNAIKPLQNGTEAYPEMLAAIKAAKKEVLVESYIFDSDDETDKFIEAFKIAAQNGAQIKVLIDGVGTLKFFRRNIEKKLKTIKNLKYAVFLPPLIPIAFPFLNMRNHRKIMAIDGQVSFFGGMNLSKENVLIDDIKKAVLDITFRVEGPLIDQILQVFESDWEFATRKPFEACHYISSGQNEQNIPARVIANGPDNKNNVMDLIIHGAVNFAIKRIVIVTPYFLPENHILTSLEMAAMKGVSVEIIIPEVNDHPIMRWAEQYNFRRLTQRGVKIYRTHPPFDHSKIFIIDDEWAFIGSANWDVRSFRLHFEANIELFDKNLVKQLFQIAQKKKEKAQIVTIEYCKKAGFFKRLRTNACHLLTPYY
jgi:cardiolipin synthase